MYLFIYFKWQGAAGTFRTDIKWFAGLDFVMLCPKKERMSHEGTQWFLLNKHGQHVNIMVFCNQGLIKKGKKYLILFEADLLILSNKGYLF